MQGSAPPVLLCYTGARPRELRDLCASFVRAGCREESRPMSTLKVFVSHSHEDDAFCRQLVSALRQAEADVWYDEHNLGSGQLLDTIESELRVRPVFVLILSGAALRSQWVRNETKWAFTQLQREPERILLPVLASAVEQNDI